MLSALSDISERCGDSESCEKLKVNSIYLKKFGMIENIGNLKKKLEFVEKSEWLKKFGILKKIRIFENIRN